LDGAEALPLYTAAPQAPLYKSVSPPAALQIIARSCIGQIKVCQRKLRRRSEDALHEARVALRRWRTALSLFDDYLTDDGRRLNRELDWLAGELNEARDLDVFAPSLQIRRRAREADRTALRALADCLDLARARAYERAETALRSERARRLLWEGGRPIHAFSARQGESGSSEARRVVAKSLARRCRQLNKQGPRLAKLEAGARHRLRIRAKKARYAAELFGELFGRPKRQRRFARALKGLQDALGELNDIHVGKTLAQGLALEAGAIEAAFEAGLIAGARSGRETLLLERAGKAYDRFARVGRFW
jgi:CHAD domain-containing protein